MMLLASESSYTVILTSLELVQSVPFYIFLKKLEQFQLNAFRRYFDLFYLSLKKKKKHNSIFSQDFMSPFEFLLRIRWFGTK